MSTLHHLLCCEQRNYGVKCPPFQHTFFWLPCIMHTRAEAIDAQVYLATSAMHFGSQLVVKLDTKMAALQYRHSGLYLVAIASNHTFLVSAASVLSSGSSLALRGCGAER